MRLRLPWKIKRRPLDQTGLTEATAARVKAEQALTQSVQQLHHEERTIVQPLRRARHEMLAHNHVADNIKRIIRESGE